MKPERTWSRRKPASARGAVVRAALAALGTVATIGCTPDDASLLDLQGATMGTFWSARVAADPLSGTPELSRDSVRRLIEAELESVNQLMSHYLETSELSLFNARADTLPVEISQHTAEVLQHALEIGILSGGAFDVTVGPLVDAWGFGPAEARSVPADEEIDQLLAATGHDRLRLDPDAVTLAKRLPSLRVDLSALAKGYAVDRVAEALLSAGFDDLMVEIGGEVRAHGSHPDGRPWQIAIEHPQTAGRSIQRIVPLRDGAVATSGDYRIYRDVDGRRLSHLLDPRTGRPVNHGLASVTVFEPLCVRADAFATALLVLGPDAGFSLASELNLVALFLIRDDEGRIAEKATSAFLARFEISVP